MIVLYLSGGLGNQLFNYSAAKVLSLKKNAGLIIDASAYISQWSNASQRPVLLQHFPITAQFRHLGSRLDSSGFYSRVQRRFREELFVQRIERKDGHYGFFQEFNDLGKNVILRGYFISPLFFCGMEDLVRKELSLPDDFLDRMNDSVGDQLLSETAGAETSVGIHVRRGDYLTYANPQLYLPNIEDYYIHAMEYIAERRSKPRFFVFSDDSEWCSRKFSDLPFNVRVVGRSDDPRKDVLRHFFLLSRCRDNIITNSTFSWWAAWLSPATDKIVISPSKWDAEERMRIEEMIPENWVILPV